MKNFQHITHNWTVNNFNYFLTQHSVMQIRKFPQTIMDNSKKNKKINQYSPLPTNVVIKLVGVLKRQTLTNKTKINFHSHIYLITKQQTNNQQNKKKMVELKSRTLSISNSRLYFLCLICYFVCLGVKSLYIL